MSMATPMLILKKRIANHLKRELVILNKPDYHQGEFWNFYIGTPFGSLGSTIMY